MDIIKKLLIVSIIGITSVVFANSNILSLGAGDTLKIGTVIADKINVIDNLNGNRTAGITNITRLEVYGTNTTDVTDQPNWVRIDGPTNADKFMVWADAGVNKWGWQTYRNELAEFMYLYNFEAGKEHLVISRGGRVGINKQSNIMNYHSLWLNYASGDPTYDDLDVGGIYDKRQQRKYQVKIAVTGAVDQWTHRGSTDNGVNWSVWKTTNDCTTNATVMGNGITLAFEHTTGHSTNDSWQFDAFPQLPQGTFTIAPAMFDEVITTTNNEAANPTWRDVTYNAATLSGNPYSVFDTTNAYIYVGRKVAYNSAYVEVNTPGVNINVVAEYFNGAWTQLTSANYWTDGPVNATVSGKISWDTSTMTDWAKTSLTNKNGDYDLYWIRFHSTTDAETVPKLRTLSPQTDKRFAVYSTHMDAEPTFYVDVFGRTFAKNGFRTDTSTAYSPTEWITETRLQESLSRLRSEVWYPVTNANPTYTTLKALHSGSGGTPWITTNALSSGGGGTNTIATYVATNTIGTTNLANGLSWTLTAYASKSGANANQGVEIWAELLEIGPGVTNILATSLHILMINASTALGVYPLQMTLGTAKTVTAGNSLAVRLLAWRVSNSVSLLFYGGTTYPSALNYPLFAIIATPETDPVVGPLLATHTNLTLATGAHGGMPSAANVNASLQNVLNVGSVATNIGITIGSTDLTQGKLYIAGEGGAYTNKPLLVLNRSATGTGKLQSWRTNGTEVASVDVNGVFTGNGSTLTGITAAQVGAASTGDFVAVSNQVGILNTNTFPLQSGLNVSNRVAALELPYQPYSSTNYDVAGTVTVSYANGGAVKVTMTNEPTVIVFAADYPNNGVNRVAINLYRGTNTSIGFVVGNVTNPIAPVLTNWTPAQLIFRTAGTNLPWIGSQIIR